MAPALEKSRDVSILSFDGGGSRGVMEVYILADIMNAATLMLEDPKTLMEAYFNETDVQSSMRSLLDTVRKPVHPAQVFDMIVGTSTGALIAFGLVGGKENESGDRCPMSVEQVIELYKESTPKIFKKFSWPKKVKNQMSKLVLGIPVVPYPQDGLVEQLQKVFGDTDLTQFPGGCIAGAVARQFNADKEVPDQLELFDTRSMQSFDVVSVLQASADAPIFFETPTKIWNKNYVDGGVGGNCPLVQAIARMKELTRNSDCVNFVLSIAPPSPDLKALPKKGQWRRWLKIFPEQFTDGFAVYKSAKDNEPESTFKRLAPRSERAVKFKLDEVDVDAMLESVKDESVQDEVYFRDIMNAATIIALHTYDGGASLEDLIELARLMESDAKAREATEERVHVSRAWRQTCLKHGNPPQVAMAADALGTAYKESGLTHKSIQCHQESLEIRQGIGRVLGPNVDVGIDVSLNNLANAHIKTAEYHEAIRLQQEAITIMKQVGHKEGALAVSYGNLGICYQRLAQFDKALEMYQESHAIQTKMNPPDPVAIGNSLSNLGNCCLVNDKLQEAIQYYQQGLDLVSDRCSSKAAIVNNLGICYEKMGKYEDAIEKHKQSLEMKQELHKASPNHSDVAHSMVNLGNNFRLAGHFKEAQLNHETALQMFGNICSMTRQSDNEHLVNSMNETAKTYVQAGEWKKSISLSKQSLEIQRQRLGEDAQHVMIAEALANLGNALLLMNGHDEEALKCMNEALEMHQQLGNDAARAEVLRDLGYAHIKMDQSHKADTFLQQSVDLYKRLYSEYQQDHPVIKQINGLLAREATYPVLVIR